jgi:HEAT repeat protein
MRAGAAGLLVFFSLFLALRPVFAEAKTGISASRARAATEAEWKDPSLMRSFLGKSSAADRLELYRAWLVRSSMEKPAVSEELGYALASDLPSLAPALVDELGGLLLPAMGRGRGFWTDYGDSRTKLVGALFDRPEASSSRLALSCAAACATASSTNLQLSKSRASKLALLIGKPEGEEVRALWSVLWRSMAKGAEGAYARPLAARLAEDSRLSLWTLASRLPSSSAGSSVSNGLPAVFSDAKSPPSESCLLLAAALRPSIDNAGVLTIEATFDSDSPAGRLVDSGAKAGDSALRDLIALTDRSAPPASGDRVPSAANLDIADLSALGDWEAGLALMRIAGAGVRSAFPEAALIALLDPSRPTEAAAAASLLSGSRSPAAMAALASLVKDKAARDPVLIVIAMRVLAAMRGADVFDILSPRCADAAPEVREAACQSLARLGDKRALPSLLSGLDDRESSVRIAAAIGLGELGDPRCVDQLGTVLLDPAEGEELKKASAMALGKIGDAKTMRAFVAYLLMPRGSSASDGASRSYAAMSLGQKREKSATGALLKNIDPTRESDLNFHCLVALGRIADPEALRSLLPIVRKGLPVWKAAPASRTPAAACWALLALEPELGRRFYLERWRTGAKDIAGAKDGATKKLKSDPSSWYAALYLLGSDQKGSSETAERAAWESHLVVALESSIAFDCVMAGEAIDRYPVHAVLVKAASLLEGLDPYAKSWIASALSRHPEPSMLSAFRALLDCEDDYLAYAALVATDRLLAAIPSPPPAEMRAELSDFRSRLSSLSAAQLAGGTREWRDVVQRRLEYLLRD